MTSLSKKILISSIAGVVLVIALIAAALGYTYYRAVTGKGEVVVPEFTLTPSADIKLGDLVEVKSYVKCPWGRYPDKAELKVSEGVQVVAEPDVKKTDTSWGKSVWEITAKIQPYRIGAVKKSECSVDILREKDGKTTSTTVKGEIPGFEVLAVDTGNNRKLDIASNVKHVSLAENNPWILVLIAILALAGTIIFLLIWLRKRKEAIESIILPPWVLALSLLDELRNALKERKMKGQVCISRLSDIVRNYLEQRFDIRAPAQTTPEFLLDLDKGGSPLETEHKQFLRDFLTAADMVKFAKLPADEVLLENALAKAEQLVESTTPDENEEKIEPKSELQEAVDEITEEPITSKEILMLIVFSGVLILFCITVLIFPDLISIDTSKFSGSGGRRIATCINLLWSRPAGIIAGVLGLLGSVGVFSTLAWKIKKRNKGAQND